MGLIADLNTNCLQIGEGYPFLKTAPSIRAFEENDIPCELEMASICAEVIEPMPDCASLFTLAPTSNIPVAMLGVDEL